MDRQPLSDEHRMRIGAALLGISFEDYRTKTEALLKWCFGCRAWKPRNTAFQRRASLRDGLTNECRDCINPRSRETMRRLYQRRKAARQAAS